MNIFIIIFSFYLEGVVSLLNNPGSLLVPLFTIISFVLIYPYYKQNNKQYILTVATTGFFYDIVYTNVLFLNLIIFFIIALIIIKLYDYMNVNILNTISLSIGVIIIYRLLIYLLLFITSYLNFNADILSRSIYSSLIINVIYTIIMYFIITKLAKILKITKME